MTEIGRVPIATLLRKNDYKVMEWKNGKGRSEQIEIFPKDAAFPADPFLWRLSCAHVTHPGPFSSYPGYQRFLTVIQGKGLKLFDEESKRAQELLPGEVIQFPGEEAIHAEPLNGDVTDLNLIFQRDQIDATFEHISLAKKPRSFKLEGNVNFLFGIAGSIAVSLFPGDLRFVIQEGTTLRVENSEGDDSGSEVLALLEPKASPCSVIVIEVSPKKVI